jgi:hypothetical protein
MSVGKIADARDPPRTLRDNWLRAYLQTAIGKVPTNTLGDAQAPDGDEALDVKVIGTTVEPDHEVVKYPGHRDRESAPARTGGR